MFREVAVSLVLELSSSRAEKTLFKEDWSWRGVRVLGIP